MNKKRFTWKIEKLQNLDDEVLLVVDNANKEWKGHILNIVDLLNKLNDERMMYRITIDKKIVELEEKNNQLTKDIKSLLNEKRELENKLQIYEHELNCCDGLYASDNEEFEDYFRLDFSNIISYPVGDDE